MVEVEDLLSATTAVSDGDAQFHNRVALDVVKQAE